MATTGSHIFMEGQPAYLFIAHTVLHTFPTIPSMQLLY